MIKRNCSFLPSPSNLILLSWCGHLHFFILCFLVALADNRAGSAQHCQLKPSGESVNDPHSSWKKTALYKYSGKIDLLLIHMSASRRRRDFTFRERTGQLSHQGGLTVSGSFILVIRICIIMTGQGYRMLCSNPLQ